MVLRPKKSKILLLLLASLAFTVIGFFMIRGGNTMGWFVALFFGLCLLVFIIQLFPGASQLKLTEEGFIMTSLFKSHFTKWSDVKAFEADYLGPNKTVVFDFIDSHTGQTAGKDLAKSLSGSHGALPSAYGLKAVELAKIMKEWKANNTPSND